MLEDGIAAAIREATVWALPILFAVPLHEAAHGLVAYRLGDDTAYRQGRVTLNPLRHIDPFGTVVLPLLLLIAHSAFLFGYAKPVPVAFNRLRHPRRDTMLVAAAGPTMNILLALISALLIHEPSHGFLRWLRTGRWKPCSDSMYLNSMLAVFNMIPAATARRRQGLRSACCPAGLARPLAQVERYGMLILLIAADPALDAGPRPGNESESICSAWLFRRSRSGF